MSTNPETVDAKLKKQLSELIADQTTLAAAEAVAADVALVENVTPGALLQREYTKVRENVWRLHKKQWSQGKIGRLARRAFGRDNISMDYFDDPDHLELAWDFADIMIATPALFTENGENDGRPIKFGWEFAVPGNIPEVIWGNIRFPMVAYLQAVPTQSVAVNRVATDVVSGQKTREPWYTVYPGSTGSGFYNHADHSSAEELTYWFESGQDAPTKAERDGIATLHAIALARRANEQLQQGL